MNATEFLKLVEMYPLPWEYIVGDGYQYANPESPYGRECVEYDYNAQRDLIDAAPAMAAAILGLASRVKRAETGAVFDMEVEIEALCAALPEELRP